MKVDRQKIALKRQIAILSAREEEDYLAFIKLMNPTPESNGDPDDSTYIVAPFHQTISQNLMDAIHGRKQNLIITMPPRHGKSDLSSRYLPAYFIGKYPHKQVMICTYNDDFAADFGADIMKIVDSPAYAQVFPDVKFTVKSKTKFITTKGGKIHLAGKQGSTTGMGAHLLILDDIIKDAVEANSPTMRDRAWDWMNSVAMTRLMGQKTVIMTWTRWHMDDPIGRLSEMEGVMEDYTVINLPALCVDENDGTGRKIGDPLWPGEPHFLDKKFLETRRDSDPIAFEAMYQGNPMAVEGMLFNADDIITYEPDELPENLRYYAASDHAVSTKTRADSTVLIKAGIDEKGIIWITNCYWNKANIETVADTMMMMGGCDDIKSRPIVWWAESGQIGLSLYPLMMKRMQEKGVYFNLKLVTADTDKLARAQSISARIKAGMVRFPAPKGPNSWTTRAIDELTKFPGGKHDDFVDAISHLGLQLAKMVNASGPDTTPQEKQYETGTFGWVKKTMFGRPNGNAKRSSTYGSGY